MANRKNWKIPRADAVRLYESGASLAEVAQACGLGSSTPVKDHLRAAGVRIRPRGARPGTVPRHIAERALRLDVDEVRRLRSEGLSTRQIAERLGCSEEPVRRLMAREGIPRLAAKARPEHNHFWRGGYHVDKQGYILRKVPGHPQATRAGYVRVHRLLMQERLGRLLTPEEVVDHRNGDTSDNHPDNLRLFATNADHLRATLTGRKPLPTAEREALRLAAVRRARRRVAAILAESGSGDDR